MNFIFIRINVLKTIIILQNFRILKFYVTKIVAEAYKMSSGLVDCVLRLQIPDVSLVSMAGVFEDGCFNGLL